MSEPETEVAQQPPKNEAGNTDAEAKPEETTGANNTSSEVELSAEEEKVPEIETASGSSISTKTSENTPTSSSNGPSHKRRSSLVTPPETVIEGESDREDEPPQQNTDDNNNNNNTQQQGDDDPWIIPDSDLKDPNRRICVVTTAALPWRTGTAVNPLLRALYLTRGRPKHYVSLVIPWCPEEKDRILTLGKDHSFATSEEQEAWIREFCRDRAGCSGKLCLILFV